jgi:hypothetical protein
MSDHAPLWIKYWGLIPMTRRGYLITLAVAAGLAVAVFVILEMMGRLPAFRTLWTEVPVRAPAFWEYWLYNNLYRILLICLVAQIIDTYLVLRRFAKKHAEQLKQDGEASCQAAGSEKGAGSSV